MTSTDLETLVERLQQARDAYYDGDAIMSDAEYDALEDQLRELDPAHPLLKQVGTKPTSGWVKVKHGAPMGSLDKCQSVGESTNWYGSTVSKLAAAVTKGDLAVLAQDFIVSEKLDGISISLKYDKGKLVQAVTRGDGDTGEDITRNVLLMQGVQKKIRDFTGYVRGEIILKKSVHEKHVPEYKNPRNAASGIAKRESDPDPCKYLSVVCYQILSNEHKITNKVTEFKLLKALGFETPEWYHVTGGSTFLLNGTEEKTLDPSEKALPHIYDSYVKTWRAKLDYDIDGLVVEFNDREAMEYLGEHNGRPKGAHALKFPHEAKPTALRDIVWQVGNSGRVTPVAVFDPVDLAGATVTQASLHNETNIRKLAAHCLQGLLGKGDIIMVSRRNDVIPYVESVVMPSQQHRFAIPTQCPSCKHPIKKDGEYLLCTHPTCPAQVSGSVKRWVKKLDIKDWGDSLIDALCESGLVSSPADLYKLNADVIAGMSLSEKRVGKSTAKKVLANLEAKKELRIADFVGSLGIHLCGRSIAQMIADAGFDTLEKMEDASVAQIAAIPRMGQTKAEAFVAGLKKSKKVIDELLDAGVTIQAPITGSMSGKSFCFTGFRDKSLEDKVLNAGGSIKSSVGKNLSYLVAKDPSSNSGKVKKARDYGIQVIGIPDLEAMF